MTSLGQFTYYVIHREGRGVSPGDRIRGKRYVTEGGVGQM